MDVRAPVAAPPPHHNVNLSRTVNDGHRVVNREVAQNRDWSTLARHYPDGELSLLPRSASSNAIMSGQRSARNVIATPRSGCTMPSEAACNA